MLGNVQIVPSTDVEQKRLELEHHLRLKEIELTEREIEAKLRMKECEI